ncbi:MAG TPA: hypothetical protein VNA69_01790 [Thermoanaerobaculia bacterium]|nr:hypothetical protein [Thermoanaerobaculia bacterium]
MTSSYRGDSAGITVNSGPVRQSPDDAAAIIASQRRVLILGTSAPGTHDRSYVSDGRTNQFTYPGLVTNPQITVNSSIHSVNMGAAITSGAGVDTSVVADAAVFPATGTIVTPTTAALGVSPGVVAGGAVAVSPTTGTVTGASGATPTPTTAALNVSPTVASAAGGARTVGLRGATSANSVQITNTNGRVTVTNVPVTARGSSQ